MERSDESMVRSMAVLVSLRGSERVGVGELMMERFVAFIWCTNSCDGFVDLVLPQMG